MNETETCGNVAHTLTGAEITCTHGPEDHHPLGPCQELVWDGYCVAQCPCLSPA